MKTHFRLYRSNRPARFSYPPNEVTLVPGTLFQLGEYNGRPVVILDGFRYPIKPQLVAELKRRSEVIKPSNEYRVAAQRFDKLGHTLVKWVDFWMRKISHGVESGFRQGQVYAKFDDRGTVYALQITPTSLGASVYAPEKQQVHVEQINNAIHRIASRMKKDFGASVSEFKDMTSHVGNVSLPWGNFSGIIYSHVANWSIK